MGDKHNKPIPVDVMSQVKEKLDEISGLLSPYYITLTPKERHDILKMGDKTLSFVEKAGEFAGNNPEICPPFLNVEAFKVDLTDAQALRGVENHLRQILNGVEDTMMAAGSEAYEAALIFYNAAGNATHNDVAGAKAVFEELKARFMAKHRRSKTIEGTK